MWSPHSQTSRPRQCSLPVSVSLERMHGLTATSSSGVNPTEMQWFELVLQGLDGIGGLLSWKRLVCPSRHLEWRGKLRDCWREEGEEKRELRQRQTGKQAGRQEMSYGRARWACGKRQLLLIHAVGTRKAWGIYWRMGRLAAGGCPERWGNIFHTSGAGTAITIVVKVIEEDLDFSRLIGDKKKYPIQHEPLQAGATITLNAG